MENRSIAEQLNETIEAIWIMLEKEERSMTNVRLNNQQHVLLTLIIRYPSSSPTELASKMEISKSALSQQLSKLEREGYITKKQHNNDKRAFSVELGEKGSIYKKELDSFNERMLNKYYSKLSSEELSSMLYSFLKLKEVMSK